MYIAEYIVLEVSKLLKF